MFSDKWINYFSKVAQETATLSYAKKLQVGCVIVRDKRIILCGYNGTAEGFPNECEDKFGDTLSNVFHAEENAILYASKMGISLKDSQIFINYSPCIHCAKMIFASGIKEVYYNYCYRNSEGLNFLKNVNIDCYKI